MGCAFPEAEQGMNVGRIVGVLAGLPRSVAGATINRFCGSAMQAIHTAAGSIAMGMGEAYVAGGTESMSRVPMIGFNFLPHPGLAESLPADLHVDGRDRRARRAALRRSRASGRRRSPSSRSSAPPRRRPTAGWRRRSRRSAPATASSTGDGCLRPATTAEGLAALKPAFQADGSVTAGTSSPLTDGATACLVTQRVVRARAHGIEPLARDPRLRRLRLRPRGDGHRARRRPSRKVLDAGRPARSATST